MIDCIKQLKLIHWLAIPFILAGLFCFVAIFLCLFGDWSLMKVGL